MVSEAIVFQSVMQNSAPVQQISNLSLGGLSTEDATLNTDNSDPSTRGKLYGSFTKSGSTYLLNLYKDVTKLDLVAHASDTSLGVKTLIEDNGSGLSGTINFASYSADDTAITAICFLSKDTDLPMDNLQTLSEYDLTNGFADFHLQAFKYLCREFVVSRYKSKVWNPELIDTSQINGGVGGYDLSRVLNLWVLREASAHYAFSRLAEKQAVDNNSIFAQRAKESKGILRAHLQSVELIFDMHNQRVESESRSLSVWKIARA